MIKQVGDMYLAAALLSYDAELTDINKSNSKRQMFVFTDSVPFIYILDGGVPVRILNPTLEQVETYFISKKLMYPPSYPDAIRRIKCQFTPMTYSQVNNQIVNENGEVAIRYYMTVPQFLTVNGHEYMFGVNANICMAWVQSSDVDRILATQKVCCGNQVRSDVYKLADETHVRRWLGISDR